MLEFATSFHNRVKGLKSPTGRDFNVADWVAARSAEPSPTDSDDALLAAAIWLASQSAARRAEFDDSEFANLSAATSTILAIAALNREFLVTVNLSDEATEIALQEGAVAFGHVVARPLRAGSTKQRVTADEASEGTVDAVESWLFDIDPKASRRAEPANLAPIAMRAIRRYSIQHGLNVIWNQALWEGWRLTVEDSKITWSPPDFLLATKLEAALVRQHENFMNFPFIDIAAWTTMRPEDRRRRALPHTVVSVSTNGRRRIRVGRPECRSKRPPMFLIERAGLEGSYLNFLLDAPFPKNSRFTVRMLLQAWAVILDLANLLARDVGGQRPFTLPEARKMALVVSKRELLDVLIRALGIDEAGAAATIEFLTYTRKRPGEKGHRGLWAAPLVPIPGGDDLALARPALALSNPLRKAEAWLERGGLDDNLSKNSRGNAFEADYRAKAVAAIEGNPLLTKAVCARNAIKNDANFSEQIDLLIRLGDLLIVGEVKCWLYPADSFERFTHFRKIKNAAGQARRKADMLRLRPDISARALGLSEDEIRPLRLIPVVVANQGFGFSMEDNGCRITDAAYLLTYLRTGTIATSGAMNGRTGQSMTARLTLYEREQQASDRFEALFETPPVLQRFVDRINWATEIGRAHV